MSNVRRKSRQAPLSRDRILDAAVRLADEGGVESISMRKLGQALGVEAMSLYNHVANKDDVVAGIAERVAAEFESPSLDEPWDVSIRDAAMSARGALRRHPWACSVMLTTAWGLPSRLRFMDGLLACLREAGFSPEDTYHAYHALDGHIFGFSLWLASHEGVGSVDDLALLVEQFREEYTLDDYPDLSLHVEQHVTQGPHQDVSAFELGLDLILEGLRKVRAR